MSDVLARAEVIVNANLSSYDKAMELLPGKARKQITAAMREIEKEMKAVKLEIGNSSGNAQQLATLTAYQKQLAQSMDRVKLSAVQQAASLNPMNKGIKAAGKNLAFGSNKLQVFAQGLDDLQYVPEQGLRPILNNLVQMSPALGIVGLAIQQVVSHWDELAKAFGHTPFKTQAQQLEELAKKLHKTADEQERLNKANRVKDNRKEQDTAQSESEQERSGRFGKAVAEEGRDKVAKGMVEIYREQYKKRDPTIGKLERQNEDEDIFGPPKTAKQKADRQARIDARNKEIEARTLDQAREHLAFAQADPNSARSIARDIEKNPGIFGDKFRKNLQGSNEAPQDLLDKETAEKDDKEIEEEEAARENKKRLLAIRRDRAREAGKGLGDKSRLRVLGDIATGKEVDRGRVEGEVATGLRARGHTEDDIKRLVPTIVDDLLKDIKTDVKERANKEGTTEQEAGFREAAKLTTETQQRGTGGFSDLTSFYQKLQQSQDAKDPYQAAIAKATQETAKTNLNIFNEIKNARKQDRPNGLVGPA